MSITVDPTARGLRTLGCGDPSAARALLKAYVSIAVYPTARGVNYNCSNFSDQPNLVLTISLQSWQQTKLGAITLINFQRESGWRMASRTVGVAGLHILQRISDNKYPRL